LFEEVAPTAAPAPSGTKESATKSTSSKPGVQSRLAAQLRQELSATREYLQSVITEHERTNEELQSANEEILSSNEELQSTNEELETAKEELQSTNEELTTVKEELNTRNTEITQINNDLENLLNSVQIPIVFLGSDLRIRRFTPPAERLLSLIPTDVGRPLNDLRPNVLVPEFEQLVAEVLRSLTPREVEVQDRQGRWHSLRVRPYRTLDNKIEGVILALVDIDDFKKMVIEKQGREFAEAVVATVRQPLLVLDGNLRVRTANRAFYEMFQVRPDETENQFIYNLGAAQWNIVKLRKLLGEILPRNLHFENFEVDAEFPGVGRKKLLLNAHRIADDGKRAQWILLPMEEAEAQ
jgi:two-component system CheB/CheR fusion protein